MEKYYSAPAAKDHNKKVAEANRLKTFFIKGKVHATVKYKKTTNKGTVEYPKTFKEEYPDAKEVRATSLAAAEAMFRTQAAADFDLERGYWKTVSRGSRDNQHHAYHRIQSSRQGRRDDEGGQVSKISLHSF